MKALSVYDLDHTLIKVNSSFSFGVFLYYRKILPLTTMLKLLCFYGLHKIGALSPAAIHKKAGECFFQGQPIAKISALVTEFLDLKLQELLDAKVVEQFEKERAAGSYLVILSNSPDFIVSQVAERLRADEWGATEYIVNGGGVIEKIGRFMDGEDKAGRLRLLMERFGIGAANTTAYSDSYLDLPLLELAGRGVAVNPDARLKRICRLRGWKVLDN